MHLYDVIVLQEVWHSKVRRDLESIFKRRKWNVLKSTKKHFGKIIDSGVWIVTPWKVLSTNETVFDECNGPDIAAQKGAISTIVNIEGKIINIVGTHFQDSDWDLKGCIRKLQAEYIADSFSLNNIPNVIVGDFNTTPSETTFGHLSNSLGRPLMPDCNTHPSSGKIIDGAFINGKISRAVAKTLNLPYNLMNMSDHMPVEIFIQV
jgi:endonuclease/exonuclease/phosphatase family metal-dependent hydrolase